MKKKDAEKACLTEGQTRRWAIWHTSQGAYIDNVKNTSERDEERGDLTVSMYHSRRKRWSTWVACCLLFGILAIMLWRTFDVASQEAHLPQTPSEWGVTVGSWLLLWGLPDLHTPLWENAISAEGVTSAQTQAETDPSMIPVVNKDMSAWHLGYTHWQGERDCIPPSRANLESILTPEKQSILVVCSHPYATYGTGEDMVSMDEHFAVEMPSDRSHPTLGVAVLAHELCVQLQALGIDAVFLSCVTGDGNAHTYEATSERVAEYLTEHEEVGLVIDVNRSGELLPSGELPRSLTEWHGNDTAQVQVMVDTNRGIGASGDYTFGLLLREAWFDMSPTLSRPIYLRRGGSLTASDEVVFLTIVMGTAGNVYEEAYGLVSPVAEGIGSVWKR